MLLNQIYSLFSVLNFSLTHKSYCIDVANKEERLLPIKIYLCIHPFKWEFTIKRVIPEGNSVSGHLYNHIKEPNFYAVQYMSTYAI